MTSDNFESVSEIPIVYLNPDAKIQINLDNTAEAYLKRGISKKHFLQFVEQIIDMQQKCMGNQLYADFNLGQMEVVDEHIVFKVYVAESGLSVSEIKEYLKTLAYKTVFQGEDFLQTVYEYLSFMDQPSVTTLEQIREKVHFWLTGEKVSQPVAPQLKKEIPMESARIKTEQLNVTQPLSEEVTESVRMQTENVSRYEGQYSQNGETGVLDPAFWSTVMNQQNEEDPNRVRRQNNKGASLLYLKTGEKVAISKPEFSIGKSRGADMVLSDSSISRKHADITIRNGHYFVTDDGSTNGTFVNGRRLPARTPIEIFQGDLLRFAEEEMKFQVVQ